MRSNIVCCHALYYIRDLFPKIFSQLIIYCIITKQWGLPVTGMAIAVIQLTKQFHVIYQYHITPFCS